MTTEPLSGYAWVMKARETEAKQFCEWYAGERDRHPQGMSGLRFVIDGRCDNRTDDGGASGQGLRGLNDYSGN